MVFISWITRIARGGNAEKASQDNMVYQRSPNTPEAIDMGELIGVNNGHTRGNLDVVEAGYDVVSQSDEQIVGPTSDDTLMDEEPKAKPKGCIEYLKVNGYWGILMEGITFLIHFFVVMLILFMGALAFVYFEDPEPVPISANNTRNGTSNDSQLPIEIFWNNIETKYNLSLDEKTQLSLLNEFRLFVSEDDERKAEFDKNEKRKNRKFIFLKWFYFVTIATTTIGYGDISPKTDNGKYFYIFFSIIGIGLMMTLLKKCGAVISAANTKLYGLIDKLLRRGENKCISNELLTSISITMIFGAYLWGGIYYGRQAEINWSTLDLIYYWIVTFTTVGFGDIAPPLETEINHIYFYVVYRIFGLAFLAAIIDALSEYAEQRKIYFEKKQAEMKEKLQAKMQAKT